MTENVLSLVDQFMRDARLYVLLGMIVLDFIFGVAEALKTGVFQWDKVGQFYTTNVVPYILGYLALYVAVGMNIGLKTVVGEGAVTAAFGAALAPLLSSFLRHAGAIGFPFGKRKEGDYGPDNGG